MSDKFMEEYKRDTTHAMAARIKVLEARIAKLEAALREIAIYDADITKTLREALQ